MALQSEYCARLLKARELGLDAPVSIDVKPTIAEGIAIGKPLRGSELFEMMKKHDITVVAAPEDKILAARAKIARAGLYIEHDRRQLCRLGIITANFTDRALTC